MKINIKITGLISVLLLMALIFSACTKTAPASEPETAPTPASKPETVPAPTSKPKTAAVSPKDTSQNQKELIMSCSDIWMPDDDGNPWYYTITDLDCNGRMEIIVRSCQGADLHTYIDLYEVSSDFSTLEKCSTNLTEGDFLPDLNCSVDTENINGYIDCYYSTDTGLNLIYYIFDGVTRNGMTEFCCTKNAVFLENGTASRIVIAEKDGVYKDGSTTPEITCYDAKGNQISETEYDSSVELFFKDLEKIGILFEEKKESPFEWTVIGKDTSMDLPGNAAPSDLVPAEDNEYTAVYAPVINEYKTAVEEILEKGSYDSRGYTYDLPWEITHIRELGYALEDLDNNGVPELLIFPYWPETNASEASKIVWAAYTLVDDRIVTLFTSGGRYPFFLRNDNLIFCRSSGGAANIEYKFFRVDGASLRFVEGFQTYNSEYPWGSSPLFHSVVPDKEYPHYGDYDNYDYIASWDELNAILRASPYRVPPLTPIT